MYFISTIPLHFYEVMMQGIPNFKSRRSGIQCMRTPHNPQHTKCEYCLYFKRRRCILSECPYIDDKVADGTATRRQILEETFKYIKNPIFRNKLEKFIKESESNPMTYFDKHHETQFQRALSDINTDNFAVLSVVYLLTAEFGLWRKSRDAVKYGCVNFDRLKLGSVSERAYTLYACASDLYKGTKHLTIADLCDTNMISPKMFGIICNAMAIRRFGVGAINSVSGGAERD